MVYIGIGSKGLSKESLFFVGIPWQKIALPTMSIKKFWLGGAGNYSLNWISNACYPLRPLYETTVYFYSVYSDLQA
jgi:hypothetical protein